MSEINKNVNNIDDDISFLVKHTPSIEYATKLQKFIETYKLQTMKINRSMQIDIDINEKIKTTLNLIQFIKTICKSAIPFIFGSFPRMLFERAFHSSLKMNGYGNTINHDIDLYLYNTEFVFNKYEFDTLIYVLELTKSNITFGNYKLYSVTDKTITSISNVSDNAKNRMLNIPHYVIILHNGEKFIKYDLLGYKISSSNSWTNEFDINSLCMGHNGINSDVDFYNTLMNIMNFTAECTINFKRLIQPLEESNMRSTKVHILNDILYFSCMRTKILSVGYVKIYNEAFGNIILTIEKENDCFITGNKPPYLQLELVCGHICSLMAIAGIVNTRSSEYTESILCPMCRHQLIPKLADIKNPNKLQNYQPDISIMRNPQIPLYETDDEIITQENRDYVNGLIYGLTPQEILSNRATDRVIIHDYRLIQQLNN